MRQNLYFKDNILPPLKFFGKGASSELGEEPFVAFTKGFPPENFITNRRI